MIPLKIKHAIYSRNIRKRLENRQRLLDAKANLGIITDAENPEVLRQMEDLSAMLGFSTENLNLVVCDAKPDSGSRIIPLKSNEISTSGKFKSKALKDFVSKDYDLLICYFTKRQVPGALLAAEVKAKLIFGNKPDHFDLFDLEISGEGFEIFQQEIKKYYKIFKTS